MHALAYIVYVGLLFKFIAKKQFVWALMIIFLYKNIIVMSDSTIPKEFYSNSFRAKILLEST